MTFSVAAGGSLPLRYQWRKDGGTIAGATNASYSIANVQSNHAGLYSVVVSNALGSVTSSNAVLTVLPRPTPMPGTVAGWGRVVLPYVEPGTRYTKVAAGTWHSLALRSDGTVVAWGYNYSGQCNVPVGLTNVVAIAGGGAHSLALTADGAVVAWGWNEYGQCNVPAGLSNVVAIAGGDYHSLALVRADVAPVWVWPLRLSAAGFEGWLEVKRQGNYRIDWSDDLVSWDSLMVLTNGVGRIHVIDPSATGAPRRFYRAVLR